MFSVLFLDKPQNIHFVAFPGFAYKSRRGSRVMEKDIRKQTSQLPV